MPSSAHKSNAVSRDRHSPDLPEFALQPNSSLVSPTLQVSAEWQSRYPIEGGAFDLASRELLIGGEGVNWRDAQTVAWVLNPFDAEGLSPEDAPRARRRKTPSRTRFECPGCKLSLHTRRSARLACLDCERPLIAS